MAWYNPFSWDSISDVPIVGGLYDAARGNPDAVKGAYDSAIAGAKESGGQIRDFLQQQKQGAQAFYGPVQGMLHSLYGRNGIKPAMMPGVPGSSPLFPQQAQQPQQGMIQGMLPPAPPASMAHRGGR